MTLNAKENPLAKGVILRRRFGLRVNEAMIRAGLTPDALATFSGLTRRRVQKILEGTYGRLTMRDMVIIARAVDIPLHVLLSPAERKFVVPTGTGCPSEDRPDP